MPEQFHKRNTTSQQKCRDALHLYCVTIYTTNIVSSHTWLLHRSFSDAPYLDIVNVYYACTISNDNPSLWWSQCRSLSFHVNVLAKVTCNIWSILVCCHKSTNIRYSTSFFFCWKHVTYYNQKLKKILIMLHTNSYIAFPRRTSALHSLYKWYLIKYFYKISCGLVVSCKCPLMA